MSDVKVNNIRSMFEGGDHAVVKPHVRPKPPIKLPPKPSVAKKPGQKPPNLELHNSTKDESAAPEIPLRNNGAPKRLASVKSPLSPNGPTINLGDILNNKNKLHAVPKRESMVSALTANFETKNESVETKVVTKKVPPPPLTRRTKTCETRDANKDEAKDDATQTHKKEESNNNITRGELSTDLTCKTNDKDKSADSSPSNDAVSDTIVEFNNIKYKECTLPRSPGPPPSKPVKPTNVVLARSHGHIDRRLPSLPPVGGNRAVSLIQPMEEDEEEEKGMDEVYDDNMEPPAVPTRPPKPAIAEPIEDETYDDIGNQPAEDDAIDEDIYEEFDGENTERDDDMGQEIYDDTDPAVPGGSTEQEDAEKKLKEEKERKAKEEKERKEKEKLEKEEKKRKEKEEKERLKKLKEDEKEKKRKAEEEKKMLAKFKLTGNEEPVNTGTVSQDCKGGKYELMVKAGDQLDIIRTNDTPSGKWLVKSQDGKYGYVSSSNVQISSLGGASDDCEEEYADVGNFEDEQVYDEFE